MGEDSDRYDLCCATFEPHIRILGASREMSHGSLQGIILDTESPNGDAAVCIALISCVFLSELCIEIMSGPVIASGAHQGGHLPAAGLQWGASAAEWSTDMCDCCGSIPICVRRLQLIE